MRLKTQPLKTREIGGIANADLPDNTGEFPVNKLFTTITKYKCYWGIGSDPDYIEWEEIPQYLWVALHQFEDERIQHNL